MMHYGLFGLFFFINLGRRLRARLAWVEGEDILCVYIRMGVGVRVCVGICIYIYILFSGYFMRIEWAIRDSYFASLLLSFSLVISKGARPR